MPDPLPARRLHEFAYCPRLFTLEWVQSEFADKPRRGPRSIRPPPRDRRRPRPHATDFLYWYQATVVHVVDGDPLDLETDLGFRVTFLQRYRLYGVDTPERNDPDPAERERALRAKDFVEVLVLRKEVVVHTHLDRRDKYGRWLATVFWRDADGAWQNLNEDLIGNGLAGRT